MRPFGVIEAVVEFGDVAVADDPAKLAEAAGLLRDRHCQDGLAALADFGAL